MYFSRPNLHIDCLRGWYFTIHTRIPRYFSQILDTAPQNFHTYVIFNAEFDGMVQIFHFLCAYVIKMKKTKLPGKTSWKVSIWHFVLYEWLFTRKIQFATLPKIQITNLTVFIYSGRSLVALFFTKIFETNFFKFSL